jgi:hypothetical protein
LRSQNGGVKDRNDCGNDETDYDYDDEPLEGFWDEKSYARDKENWAKDEAQWAIEETTGLTKVDLEWFASSEDFWGMITEVDDLGKDVFAWLYKFADNPTAPADHAVCVYHDGIRNLLCFEKFPLFQELALHPKIELNDKEVQS